MVDDDAAGPVHARAHQPAGAVPGSFAVPCLARPSTGLAHLDGSCRCFFGGPPPVFLDALERLLAIR